MIPGEYKLGTGKIVCNADYEAVDVEVKNIGDRAVQVGSHFHFYEAMKLVLFLNGKNHGVSD